MATGATTLYDLMVNVLGVVAAGYAEFPEVEPPTNQYVYATGPVPPAICSSLIVAGLTVFLGVAGQTPVSDRQVDATGARATGLRVYCYRCITAGFAPGASGPEVANYDIVGVQADAQVIASDLYIIHRALWKARWNIDGPLYPSNGGPGGYSVGVGVPMEAEGEIGGCYVPLTLELS